MKKSYFSKKVLAILLAVIMVLSAVPFAYAVPTAPVSQSAGNIKDGADGGHYVHFSADYQNFTFIQDADNQEFSFAFKLGAKKSASINYGWIYADWERIQTITEPIGTNHSVTWSSYPEGLETEWKYTDITIKFTGDGGKAYNTALKVIYDAGSTSFNDRWEADYQIPLTVKVIDKRALNQAIADAEAENVNKENYTADSWAELEKCLNEAGKYTGRVIAEQSVIDKAAADLRTAADSLKMKPADYTSLNNAKSSAKTILDAQDAGEKYTADTLRNLRDKYNAAVSLNTDLDFTHQAEINMAADELNAAVAALIRLADYSALKAAVEAYLKLNPDYYAAEKFEAVRLLADKAVNAMKPENRLDETHQSEVDAQAAGLKNAAEALEILPCSYDVFNRALADAEARLNGADIADYTAESVRRLEDAFNAAERILPDKDITYQNEVDKAAKALTEALAGLTLKNADYSKLDAKIAEAEALLKTDLEAEFTKESVNALKAALRDAKSVDRNLDTTGQKEIDAAVAKLAAAIKALAPSAKLEKVQITHNNKIVDGNVVFEKVKWYKTYKSHSAVLGYKADNDTADVKWELAEWSVDKPEAAITENSDGTVTVTPNGRGIGARSVWIKLTVTDAQGNTATDLVKVRFYKWNWQTGNLF